MKVECDSMTSRGRGYEEEQENGRERKTERREREGEQCREERKVESCRGQKNGEVTLAER